MRGSKGFLPRRPSWLEPPGKVNLNYSWEFLHLREFQIHFITFYENFVNEATLNLWINSWRTNTFTILISPIHKYSIHFLFL